MDHKEAQNVETTHSCLPPVEKHRTGHLVLVPQPSTRPRDPLVWQKTLEHHCPKKRLTRSFQNWPITRKYVILAVLCLASFSGAIAPLSGQLNLADQEKLYNKTKLEESYANSAALAGMAAGPFFFAPISHMLGRSSVIFWCVLFTLVCQIWGAVMTDPGDYIPYVISRLFAGFFGAVPTVLGPRIVTDLFFLHQRGRAFTALHMAFLFGTIAGPTFSGFVSAHSFFPVEFWWTVGLLGFSLICCFCLLEETGFDRECFERNPDVPAEILANRFATFFFGQRVVLPTTWKETAKVGITPFLIGMCPVTIIMGIFTLISFGFYVGVNALTPVWLQKPISEGGYGFSLEQNAAFTFCHWIGIIVVQFYGHYLNDRLPLALARRYNGGVWKPEYRLHVLWLPSLVINPIGLGIFGAALQYHLHYMVLALAVFIVTVGSLASVPVTVNYVVECFTRYPAEAGIVIGAYRIAYGLTISFYINPWVEAVDVGWVYGMMAFFAVFSFMFVMLLMWKGHAIRKIQFASLGSSEEGERLIGANSVSHLLFPLSSLLCTTLREHDGTLSSTGQRCCLAIYHNMQATKEAFAKCKAKSCAALITYVPAGFPTVSETPGIMPSMQAGGADIIELGIPFAEPMTEGPTIQQANAKALENGVQFSYILHMVQYCDPVRAYAYGEEKLLRDCKAAGVDGFIVVDLPSEETPRFCVLCKSKGLSYIPLVASSTPEAHIKMLCDIADSFVCVASRIGVSGTHEKPYGCVGDLLHRVHAYAGSSVPVALGFDAPIFYRDIESRPSLTLSIPMLNAVYYEKSEFMPIENLKTFDPFAKADGDTGGDRERCGIDNRQYFVDIARLAEVVVIGSPIIQILGNTAPGTGAKNAKEYGIKIAGRTEDQIVITERRQQAAQPLSSTTIYLSYNGADDTPEDTDKSTNPRDTTTQLRTFRDQYVPVSLMEGLTELKTGFEAANADPPFWTEVNSYPTYANRPSSLHLAPCRRSTYLAETRRPNHTGSHKVNNLLGQIILAR
ncbi:unnamed protein product [Penicillium egyptiacum]|uniref:tryptophan synthase n=1 Tax=Penicillium egyptiacum TaxID=1303716 RepID=A0A9W4P446_9EURO|nr:unnamed protein product [Penicillium egyptiacum]